MVMFARVVISGLIIATGTGVGVGTSAALAQQGQPASVLPGRPAEQPVGLLGDVFESKAAGISLRPPAGSDEIRKPGVADLIVEFVNADNDFLLRVGTLEIKEPRQLTDAKDASGKKQLGILNDSIEFFSKQNPTAEILRNEVETTEIGPVGHLAYRYSQGSKRRLLQQAFFPLTSKYYYVLTLTSPAAKTPLPGVVDEAEKNGADTFAEVIKSVKLIDRREIVREQAQRLKDTHKLLQTFRSPKLMNKAIMPQQWLRLTRDGQDMGYSYIVEERAKEDGRDGILISVRSRTVPGPGQQVDISSRLFISDNWQHETWSHVVNTVFSGKAEESAELGLSDLVLQYKVDVPQDLLSQPASASSDPEIREVMKYKLQVRTKQGNIVAQPMERDVPQEYLSQAIRHLLPRMLPLDEPRKYMFISYVSENRQIMVTYADVQTPREITIDGHIFQATPVQYRVGLEGIPTTYFIGADGRYLGSETLFKMQGKDSSIRIIPSDEATLTKLWKTAQLQKPQSSEVPVLPNKQK